MSKYVRPSFIALLREMAPDEAGLLQMLPEVIRESEAESARLKGAAAKIADRDERRMAMRRRMGAS